MDPLTILADVQLALSLGKMAVDLEQQAAPFLTKAYDIAFGHKTLTDAERQDMRDQEAAMRQQIDAAIADDDASTD